MLTKYRLLLSIIFIPFLLTGQTITSTTAGGKWENTSTWIGGVIPSSGSNVVVNGPVVFSTGSGYSCNSLTINSGGTLYNGVGYAWPDQVLIVNGSIVNNGTIRNDGSNGLVIKAKGNITNNGTWTFRRIELNGTGTQTISSTNKSKFGNNILVDATAKPALVAGSELIFSTTVDLGKSTLDAKNFAITLVGESANITNGTVNNAGIINGISTTDPYKAIFHPIINEITYSGNIALKGRFKINSNVVMIGTVSNTDTLENSTGYAHPEKKLQINGNFTNNGLVRNGGSAGFALNITGNVINNGTWAFNRTELSGAANQIISLGNGKVFESPFKVTDQTGQIVAGSALSFSSWFDLNKCAFDLKNYTLTLRGEGSNISNGVVFNVKDLIGKNTPGTTNNPVVENIIYDGQINLKGLLRINWGVTMRGTVTVTDTLQNSTGYAHPEKVLKIVGDLVNNGLIRDGGSAGFVLDVTGNIIANKKITNKRLQLAGIGNRTIYDNQSSLQYLSTGEKVVLVGENYLPNLSIASTSKCQLAYGAKIKVVNNTLDENLDNWSEIAITKKYSNSILSNAFFKASANVVSGAKLDSLMIQSFGHQVPTSFTGAVKCWWRLTPYTTSTRMTLTSLTLKYNDDLLGTNSESTLNVYHSEDNGITWKQVSTSANTTRNSTDNTITIIDAFGFGDYVLSSSADPSSVIPSIVVSLVGRSQIRVGPPNKYTINYYNNSDTPTDDFLITLNTGTNIHILRTEHQLTNGQKETLTPDSLFYQNEDTTLVMYVAGLGPREERTFDAILSADNKGLGKTKNALFEPLTITTTAVVIYVGKAAVTYVTAKAIKYVFDKGKDKIKEWAELTPEEKKAWEERYTKIPDENKKETRKEWALKQIGKKILSKLPNVPNPGPIVKNFASALWELAPTLRRRFFYNYSNKKVEIADEIMQEGAAYKPESSGNNSKTTQRVTSWDPNEKIGPTGFGDKKFISSAGKMNYQILFENKKEASAAAYKIAIIDTLQSVFDPESVVFGKTSHDGPQYNWVITRSGNILKWEIEGIELPPNKVPPEGEGWVTFTVNTKNNLASGTQIKNKATITFDINKPIQTNEYLNTLDLNAPTVTMNPLAASQKGTKMVVRWKSSDGADGSGVELHDVYMSVDKGPFDLVGVSYTDSLVVNALSGTHNYSFYAIAKDNVGNIQSVKPTAVSTSFTSAVEEYGSEIPFIYSLEQNYPNPFNPTTTIRFSIPKKTNVLLEVFNLLGQRVSQLVNQELSPSKYEISFGSAELASGIYFYRLTTSDFVQSKKMMLLK